MVNKEKISSLLTKILEDKKIVDVFGSEKEPICNYLDVIINSHFIVRMLTKEFVHVNIHKIR
jgi:hypothetical protein